MTKFGRILAFSSRQVKMPSLRGLFLGMAALLYALPLHPVQAQSQIFADEFNTATVNPNAWRVYDPAFFLQRTQWGLPPTFGADPDGTKYARIPIQSYNPNAGNTGTNFLGSQIFSRDTWELGNGLEFEARMRSNNLPPGLVLGFFSYGDSGEWTSTYQKTEIDYELLTTQGGNKMWLNIWDAWNPERGGPNSATLTSTPGNWNDGGWKTYLIRWLPGKSEWLVDGQVVRTETTVQPGAPQGVCFNLWAASNSWGTAYSSGINPTSNPAQNQTWSFDVDYVRVRKLAAPLAPRTGLYATYYDNADFTGTSLSRIDTTVDFDWGQSSPAPVIGPDTFSARWTGYVKPPTTGTYTFSANTDDGVRLWVNNQQLINNWVNQSATEKSGAIQLTGGQRYPITMEYYDNSGGASAKLSWSGPGIAKQIVPQSVLSFSGLPPKLPSYGTGTGLTGNYFNNSNFSGTPLIRLDPRVNFDWGTYAPTPGYNADNFTVRWSGFIQAVHSETYTLYAKSDDGIKVTVNGQTLIDALSATGSAERSGTIALTADTKYPITIEYVEKTSNALAQLSWSSPSTPKQLVAQSQLYPENVPLAPTFSAVPGTYMSNRSIAIKSKTTSATIRYTLDGSDPTESSPALPNGGTVIIKTPTALRARAYVPGWVLSPVTGGFYNVLDTIPPAVAVKVPIAGTTFVNVLPSFLGTAQDASTGSGVAKVNIVLKRLSDGYRWNGTTWVNVEYGLRCSLSGTTWRPSDPLPTSTSLTDGDYTVKAVAYDFAGNITVAQRTFTMDRTAPSVAISAPLNGATVKSMAGINGTCSDALAGINTVALTITRLADNRKWNGTGWVTSASSSIPAAVNGGTYQVTSKLPVTSNMTAGKYELKVTATDKAGNTKTSAVTVTYSTTTAALSVNNF